MRGLCPHEVVVAFTTTSMACHDNQRPPIFDWLDDHVRHLWDVRDNNHVGRVSFWFDDPKEATLFKLRWA